MSLRIIFVASVIAFSSQFSLVAATPEQEANGKWGIKEAGKWILSPDYDEITGSGPYTVIHNGKQGLIKFDSNWNGIWILSPYNLRETVTATTVLISGESSTDTTITVGSTAGFAQSGTIRIDSEIISYTETTPTTLINCKRGDSSTNASSHAAGTPVFSTTYSDSVTGSDPYTVTRNGKRGLIKFDSNWIGKWVHSPIYDVINPVESDGLRRMQVNGMWGLMDQSGTWMLTPKYVSIGQIESDGHRVVTVMVNGEQKQALFLQSEWRLYPVYDSIGQIESDGNRIVSKGGKQGLFNPTSVPVAAKQILAVRPVAGKWFLQIEYDAIDQLPIPPSPTDGKRVVTNNGKQGLVDTAGESPEWFLSIDYDAIGQYEGDGKRVVTNNSKQGLFDARGEFPEWFLNIVYDAIGPIEQGDGKRIITNNGKQGLVDTRGEDAK